MDNIIRVDFHRKGSEVIVHWEEQKFSTQPRKSEYYLSKAFDGLTMPYILNSNILTAIRDGLLANHIWEGKTTTLS